MLTVEVIEDDPTMRALLCEWLTAEGYVVCSRARIGEYANEDVAAVVINLMNMQHQGIETVRKVKRLYTDAATIGISTQFGDASDRYPDQAQALGVDRVLAKPCSRVALLAAVAGALSRAA